MLRRRHSSCAERRGMPRRGFLAGSVAGRLVRKGQPPVQQCRGRTCRIPVGGGGWGDHTPACAGPIEKYVLCKALTVICHRPHRRNQDQKSNADKLQTPRRSPGQRCRQRQLQRRLCHPWPAATAWPTDWGLGGGSGPLLLTPPPGITSPRAAGDFGGDLSAVDGRSTGTSSGAYTLPGTGGAQRVNGGKEVGSKAICTDTCHPPLTRARARNADT